MRLKQGRLPVKVISEISVSESVPNPGRLPSVKSLTRDQLQSRKDQAVRFVRDVLGDPDRAEEIADESLEDYAERRKIQITNPTNRRTAIMARGKTKAELEAEIAELQEVNQELQDQLDAVADIVSPDDEDEDEDDDDETGDDDEGAVEMIRATPPERRSEFAREIWQKRTAHYGGTGRGDSVPF